VGLMAYSPLAGGILTGKPRALWWSYGVGLFLMSEVSLNREAGIPTGKPHHAHTRPSRDCTSHCTTHSATTTNVATCCTTVRLTLQRYRDTSLMRNNLSP